VVDDLARGTATEPGCISFLVLFGPRAGELVLVIHWRDEAALAAHYGSGHDACWRSAS
jgi:quinol monooxygenase YgiN